jgi:hypothetical protein
VTGDIPILLALCLAGVVVGVLTLARGFAGYRTATRVGDTATSRVATLAAGEVRVAGTIEPAEVTLVSPLQSAPCVWYRARVRTTGRESHVVFVEERGVGFRLRDETGTIRVFLGGATIDAPSLFSGHTSLLGDAPIGLEPRSGSAFGPGEGAPDTDQVARDAAIAALLTVQPPVADDTAILDGPTLRSGLATAGREYEERRLEVGAVVTLVGTAMPFGQLGDPSGADRLDRYDDPTTGLDDPVVAAEIEAARAGGTLQSPEQAWGNAAIPGFGIGAPTRAPELDSRARAEPVASPAAAARAEQIFDIAPDTLVIAAGPDTPLLVAFGSPGEVVARDQGRFLVGLLGAVLAIGSAVAAAVVLTGGR